MTNFKKAGFIGILGFGITLLSFLFFNHISPQTLTTESIYPILDTEELESLAHLVVEVDFLSVEKQVLELDDNNVPAYWNTFTNVQVKEVLNNKGETDTVIGDIIKVIEPFASWRDFRGSYIIFSDEYYLPLEKRNSYILYLYKSQQYEEAYEIIGNHQGKYITSEYNLQSNDLANNLMLREEVPEYYIENLTDINTNNN